jgi:hypothetical protein
MIRCAIVLPLLSLVWGSCASRPASLLETPQSAPASMPDLRMYPVECDVPSVCTTTNGSCNTGNRTVPEGLGLDVVQACAWIAQRMQLGAGSGFSLAPWDAQSDYRPGEGEDGFRWFVEVCASFQGTRVPQFFGNVASFADGLRWDVPAVSFAPAGSGLGVVFDAAYAKTKLRNHLVNPGDFAKFPPEPELVYARPSAAADRERSHWPDESAGRVYRPAWMLDVVPTGFVDAGTGKIWIEHDR